MRAIERRALAVTAFICIGISALFAWLADRVGARLRKISGGQA